MSGVRDGARALLRRSPLYSPVQGWLERRREQADLARWALGGVADGAVPHVVKQGLVLRAARATGARVLVETGTYLGTMIEAMRPHFDLVLSIEVHPPLHALAKHRFRGANNVRLFLGDSASQMPALLEEVGRRPAVFWLDGHYSGGETGTGISHCPVRGELDAILERRERDALLIDDARFFGVDPAYPSVAELRALVSERKPDLAFERRLDVLCWEPSAR